MNLEKIIPIIAEYKKNFTYIDGEERYKWQAVKCFQDHWDIDAPDFTKMLHESLALASNLLDSGNYFPNRMIYKITVEEPEIVRGLFRILYDEETDLIERISTFKKGIVDVFRHHFTVPNHYQDDRAIVVYLCLQYPNRFYLYKYEMFKAFIPLIEYPFTIKKGKIENVTQYFNVCNLIKPAIKSDIELLEMHSKRLTDTEYFDESFNILTQDIIYSAVRHFAKLGVDFLIETKKLPIEERLKYVPAEIKPKKSEVVLKGRSLNHIKNEEENKWIGDLGELLVLEYEIEKLKRAGLTLIPAHVSKNKGDGLGYDILSYDLNGEEMYIEVKCTRAGLDMPFYITANELKKSNDESKEFYLYRLYNYNPEKDTADYYIRHGSLEDLCVNPIVYRVFIDRK